MPARPMEWTTGRHARLVGLISRPDLNGVEIVVLSQVQQSERWGVRCVLSKEVLSVKPTNLEPSAMLTECLSGDEVCMVLEKLPLEILAAASIVCRAFLERTRVVARNPGWQARSLSLLQLVRYGAMPHVIRAKRDALLIYRLRSKQGIMCDELFEVARHAVRSHALVETLHALLHDLPPELSGLECPVTLQDFSSHYQYDLCELQHAGDEEHFDEDQQSLLHHAAMCGAGPSIVSMLLAANPDPVHAYDANGFLPLHHAVMRGSSPLTVRALLQRTRVVDVYDPVERAGTLLHLALNGGGNPPFGVPAEPLPLTDVQNEIAALLIEEMPPPPAEWDDFVPPVQDVDDRFHRLPLHQAAIAGASAPTVAALLAAYPLAATMRDRAPTSPDLCQPRGYLPAHYALGAARMGLYSTCRACCPEVQSLLLEAYPLSQWPVLDLIRAGPAGAPYLLPKLETWAGRQVTDKEIIEADEHAASTLTEGESLPQCDQMLHLALAHAAPAEVVVALIRHRPGHETVRCYTKGRVAVLPLHLAQTAAAVDALLVEYPEGIHECSVGAPPYCEPLAYATRNRAPEEVTLSLARAKRHSPTPAMQEAANMRAQYGDEYVANDGNALTEVDGFGNARLTHPKLHMRKCSARDMRKLWKELSCDGGGDEGLLGHGVGHRRLVQRLLGTDYAFQEGASALLAATVEGDAEAVKALLDGGEDVNSASRPWGCDCSNSGGCAKCAGRRLPGGWTPLHEACLQGRADLIEMLLAAGADQARVTARHQSGGETTPLAVAVDQGHAEVVKLLEAAGVPSAAAVCI